jgi:hypothetical protein
VKGLTPKGEISPRKQNAPNSAMWWGLWVCETCFAKKSVTQDFSQSTMNTLAASENSLVSTITMIHEVLGTLTYYHLFRVGLSPWCTPSICSTSLGCICWHHFVLPWVILCKYGIWSLSCLWQTVGSLLCLSTLEWTSKSTLLPSRKSLKSICTL